MRMFKHTIKALFEGSYLVLGLSLELRFNLGKGPGECIMSIVTKVDVKSVCVYLCN